MLKDLFRKRQYATISLTKDEVYGVTANSNNKSAEANKAIPHSEKKTQIIVDENSIQCKNCESIVSKETMKNSASVCPVCGHHGRIGAKVRLELIADCDSFEELYKNIETLNPLEYAEYEEKIKKSREQSGLNEAVLTGKCTIDGMKALIGIMDSNFIMGSMGSVVGEKLTRLIEKAMDDKLPVIVFCASGGARMQEGILSLMQMAKVSAALKKLSDGGLLFIPVLTDPTTGGVTASFAMLGDIIIAEPGALIGFAGKRVIEQTIRQKLPEGFQTSEFLQEHGFIDLIVSRHDLKDTLSKLLKLHN
ncbi:acetyl-coenzyme A carboxylase carboxyl transferase subunit beta [Oxobacter pfennigii]|uniref:Acetyl-coenzyme A carboxylase carboxyl transferase subunit beta n=1 Tax=Oxobacter pfennigii TaxID=36849 RepID=A0A0P8W518_9CLOT|nr:acetyl-CoA carboxylase, carboxyltransferase subunit beta [Oxobacter pfennigii]KPU42669.1 acetyl-coenzyme A carboxylase carboxyl transferase subunit beta [Oxobacter pfennigii]